MDVSDAVIVNSSRLKSVVWNDFDRVKNGDTFMAICRHCKRKLSGSSTSGTSHLRNHLIRCQRRSNLDITRYLTKGKKKEGNLAIANISNCQELRNGGAVSVINARYEQTRRKDVTARNGGLNFNHRQSQLDLASMIILHGYPLAMVEHIGFRTFVRNLQPLFDLGTYNRVEADCREIYEREKQRIYEELDKVPGKVSLSADIWTAIGHADYLCLTAQYIDDSWQLKKKILNFLIIDSSETEDMLSVAIVKSLRDWDIERKLFSMTFDNHSTYDNIICGIRDQLSQHRFLLCDGQLFDVRCAANAIKLMVQDVLEASQEMLHKIRESIRHVRSSLAVQEKFDEIVHLGGISSQKYLGLDNSSQWNSTYIMLDAALEYRDAFPVLEGHDPAYTICPSSADWNRASVVANFLKFFLEVSNVLVGSKYHTANMYFPEICDIHLQLIEWCQNSDEFIRSLALKMKYKFDEYWKKCSLTLAISAILDPRFKMKLVEYYYPQIYGSGAQDCIKIVSDCMKALYNGHAIYSPLASHVEGAHCELSGGDAVDSKDRLTGFDKFLHENSQGQNTKSDLDKYLEEPLFPRNVEFSILNWWKVHTPRYPVLSMMARNILGIPMSKVSSESMFNTGDRTLEIYRASLGSDTLQALMCAQDWMLNELEDPTSSLRPLTLALCSAN